MKKILLFLFAIILISMGTMAQPVKRAQKKMKLYDYTRATEILNKAVTKPKYHDEAVPLLAECYRIQHDVFNTKAWYAQAVNIPDADPESYYYYAQALRTTGDYEKAKEMFKKYAKLSPEGKKGELFASYCDSVTGPWKYKIPAFEVKNVNGINTSQSDFGPAFYSGQLVFASDRSSAADAGKYGWTGRGYLDIYSSKPEAPNEFWGDMKSPSPLNSKLNQSYHDGPAAFAGDNEIYFTRSYKGDATKQDHIKTNLLKTFSASIQNGKFGSLKPFFLNSPDYSVGHPALSADGNTICFASNMPGGVGGTDLWVCKKEGDDWGKPVNLGPAINTPFDEMFPSIQEDGSLLFASDGLPGYGGLDIFYVPADKGKWGKPVNLGTPLNSSYDDFAMNYAPAGAKNGFFSSNRPGGSGNDDIYAFRKLDITKTTKPKTPAEAEAEASGLNPGSGEIAAVPGYISGLVKDKTTLKPIEGASVFIYNPATNKVKVLKTGPDGSYKMLVDRPSNFTVKAMKKNYIADCTPFPLTEIIPNGTTPAPRDLLLDKLDIDKTFKINIIYYDFDKYAIRPDAQKELDKLVRIMNENPINVELGSHTDCRGSYLYNDRLSQNRAEAAVEYIVSKGISSSRIIARGYGETKLTNKCADGVSCTPEEHQANRRTEFKVLSYNNPATAIDQFDPDGYKNGDEVEIPLMPGGFFYPCK